jgi:hypothetical protein
MQFYINFKKILLIATLVLVITGCGGGSSSSSDTSTSSSTKNTLPNTPTTNTKVALSSISYQKLFSLPAEQPDKTALILDAYGIEGLHINCGGTEVTTMQDGLFTCSNIPLNIYLGTFKIGTIEQIPQDKFIYTQDILHLPRAATMHPDVTKLSMIFQSLDEDGDLTNGISISKETIAILNNELANFSSISQLTKEDTINIINNVIQQRKILDSNTKLNAVTATEAQINLTDALSNTPATTIKTSALRSVSL